MSSRSLVFGFLFCIGFFFKCLIGCGSLRADEPVDLIAVLRLSGESIDRSGLEGMLETNTPINAFGGLSAIDYTGSDNRYIALSDRGAGDGAASFPCRFHTLRLVVDPLQHTIGFQFEKTTMLRDQQGRSMTGSLDRLKGWNEPGRCPSYDPEGVRCLGNDTLVISDEYGPYIDLFGIDGSHRKSFQLPTTFPLSERRTVPFTEGAFTNRGFEGVALSSDRKTIIGAMQGPLVQDGRIEKSKCIGLWTRWLVIDIETGKTKQLAYPMDDETTGVSEVLSVDANRYLVLERDSTSGDMAKIKKIYLADVSSASDVTAVASIRDGLPRGSAGIQKRLLIDLLDPKYGFKGPETPEKPEGITWGPSLPDGRRLLMLCFDNDFNPANPTIFAAFAVKL